MRTYGAVINCVSKNLILFRRMEKKSVGTKWYRMLNEGFAFVICCIDLLVQQINKYQLSIYKATRFNYSKS